MDKYLHISLFKSQIFFFGKNFKEVCTSSKGQIGKNDIGSFVLNCTQDSSPLNIRIRPDLSSNVLAQLPPRQKAILLDVEANGWAKIRYNDKEGFAASRFLCSCGNIVQSGRVSTNGSNLNIRRAPNTSATIIGRAPDNAAVEILQSAGEWYQINYNGIVGYSLARYITVT